MQRKRGAPALIELLRGGTQAPPSLAVPPTHAPSRPAPPHSSPANVAGRPGAVGVGPGGTPPPTIGLPNSTVPPSGTTPAAPFGAAAPAVAVEAKPSAADRARFGAPTFWQRLGRLPKPVLYLVPAAVLVFLLGWALAYQLGSRARERQDPRLNDGPIAAGPTTPDRTTPPLGPDPLNSPSPPLPGPTQPGPLAPGPNPPTNPPGPIVVGLQPGLNYLVIANMFDPRGEHIPRCQAYLGQNGVNTVAMRAAEFTTNPRALTRGEGWWVLVVVPGFAGDQFRANTAARQELEARIQGLGRKWQAVDRNIPTNFAAVFWAKHDPAKP